MKETINLTRKDLQLLVLDKTSLIVTFALPVVLIALIGSVFSSTFSPSLGITSYDYAFSKVMFWGLIGGVASSVGSMAIEKNSGTMIRLQVSPINKFQVLLGKSLACAVVLIASSVLSWLFASVFFGIKTNSILFLGLILLSNTVFFTGLMTFLSNFVKTERAAGGLSWSVLQIMACFSGIMFPIAIMPSWMITMTKFNPMTWSVQAMEIALWKEITFDAMLLPIGIPILSGIVLFGVSVFLFRWTSQK
jgi:ABC-2 type transport system permease protein